MLIDEAVRRPPLTGCPQDLKLMSTRASHNLDVYMTTEEKNDIGNANVDAPEIDTELVSGVQEEKEISTDEKVEVSEEKNEEPLQVDYSQKLDAERKRIADKVKAAEAFRERRQRREADDPHEGEEAHDDEKLTVQELIRILDERDRKHEERFFHDKMEQAARELASSDEEASAIVQYAQSRIVPTGDYQEDIRLAFGALNYERLVAQNKELKRALIGKTTVRKDTITEGERDNTSSEPKNISAADRALLKNSGFSWDSQRKVYKKVNAKTKRKIIFDPRTQITSYE